MKKTLKKMLIILAITVLVSLVLTSWFSKKKKKKSSTQTMAVEKVKLTSETPSGDLELFSWWAGDEGPALEALINVYKMKNSNVNVINATITGGSGVNAKAVLKTRMLGGDPPSSFQVHAGQELIGTWVTAGRMLDLTPLYEAEGWFDVFPEDLIKLLGTDQGIWSVPVNIHRSNVMWHVPANLEKWGVTPPKTWDEFFQTAEKLKAKGIVPLALATTWTCNHLWESVALGVLGADDYEKLWNGQLSFADPKAVKVWEVFGKILQYTNDDAASLSWQQATDMVISGQAAFNVMGDWAAGYMSTTLKLEPGKGYGWTTPPGNSGVFMFLSDSFGFPKGGKNHAATLAWLKVCGSKEGSDAFNPLKGSISARTDSDLSKYNGYLQSAAKDFSMNRIVGSLAHGVTANEGFMNDFSTVMEMFLKSRNPQQAASAAQAIAIQNGISTN
ncbi:MAG: ABC transporter substrate-binding protein [Spirochaetes bacterium]|nr:ABC transporter substrate-binding protein [Spirochaetota bacterium]